jgi:tRNA(Ile)-lysidine synthase
MLSDLTRILGDDCLIDPGRPVLVGVSGGADSLCVSDFLDQNGYSVVVAHFDHKLRRESSAEAEIVRNYAQSHDLQFILGEGDVRVRVEQKGESVEEAARNERYRFLFQSADDIQAQAVVVGHTADDQVETVLMHMLRGSGLGGLSGMSYRWLPNAWHTEIALVRPLLEVWRHEILTYCQERGIKPIIDPSNQDPTYFRNRIRLELIPYLETFNPGVKKLLWQTAEVLRGDRDLIVQMVDAAWSQILLKKGADYIAIDTNLGRDYSLGMQRHIIRRAIAQLRPALRDISFDAVDKGVDRMRQMKPSSEIDLISGLKLISEPGKLWIADWEAELPTGDWPQVIPEQSFLEVGGDVSLQSGWQISARRAAKSESPMQNSNADINQAWLDAERIHLPLLVRARVDGDRFEPYGMEGHSQKLSDFMINEKIPQRARMRWPLVCSGDQIVWVAGHRQAQSFQVTGKTTEVLKLILRRSDDGIGPSEG